MFKLNLYGIILYKKSTINRICQNTQNMGNATNNDIHYIISVLLLLCTSLVINRHAFLCSKKTRTYEP